MKKENEKKKVGNKKTTEKKEKETNKCCNPGPSGVKQSTTGKKCVTKAESWYCHLCKIDRQSDMRLCVVYQRYVHEECEGLTKADKIDVFICTHCNNSD